MNSLQLAPFDESMRLGQGYNSFLQRPCLYDAFQDKARSADNKSGANPSNKGNRYAPLGKSPIEKKPVVKNGVPQVVSYSSRIVTKISEVTRSMNISAGASIKSGSVTILGNQSAIDETKLSTSDLNAIISVKVVNQTTDIDNAKEFQAIDGVDENNFHDVYGDSYISGFIDGGEFHSLVSIRVLDSTRKEEIVSSLKERLNGVDPKSFALQTTEMSQTFAPELSQTETSIFVNWCGGGQIKPADEQWTLDTVFRAAAVFPRKVSLNPQRCWAILTRYPNNFSFLESKLKSIPVRNFANVQQYAADLLDDFMGHKSNLRIIENVLDEPMEYTVGEADMVDVRAQALVRHREKIKDEMEKITQEIEELDNDPIEKISNKRADIQPPEIWATRLPVRRTILEVNRPELYAPSERVANVLSRFNIAWSDAANERSDLINKINNPPPPPKKPGPPQPPLPAITTSKARDGMVKEDLAWVDSRDNRQKFAAFLFDESCGIPNRPIGFNDAVELEKTKPGPAWPTSLELKLVYRNEGEQKDQKCTLGYYKLDYDKALSLSHGGANIPVPNEGDTVGSYVFELKPTERIVKVRLGFTREKESSRVDGIEVQVKDGSKEGEIKGLGRKLGVGASDAVECSVPAGFSGLKGFYGHAQTGEVIDRIGVIWGK